MYWTDFHDLFTKWKAFAWIFSTRTSFLFLQDRCHGNRFWAKFAKWPLFNMMAFRKGFKYRNSAFEVIEGTLYAIFCAVLVNIGLLTPKISQGVSVRFGTSRQKSTYHTKYLSKYWTELRQLFSIGRVMYADSKAEIIFAVFEETLLW